jgi:hypothetical protein
VPVQGQARALDGPLGEVEIERGTDGRHCPYRRVGLLNGVAQRQVTAQRVAQDQESFVAPRLGALDRRAQVLDEAGVVEVLAAAVRAAQRQPQAGKTRGLRRPGDAHRVVAGSGPPEAVHYHEQGTRSARLVEEAREAHRSHGGILERRGPRPGFGAGVGPKTLHDVGRDGPKVPAQGHGGFSHAARARSYNA